MLKFINRKPGNSKNLIFVILLTYFLVNQAFLTDFPFVHSDEPWLSGLTRNMMDKKTLAITESFFDLYPRNPHALKLVYHLIQMVFIKLTGYSIYSVRLMSLIAGVVTLYYFYRLSLMLFKSIKLALITTILLALDIQFIYASHFARQEIILLMLLIGGFYIFQTRRPGSIHSDILLGLISGISIGIHPNSFIITLPFVFNYLYHLLATKKIKARQFIAFTLTLALFALFFIALSLYFDPHFLYNYLRYGEKLGVLNSLHTKLSQLPYFYLKIFYQVSGTYYTPDIRFQFILFGSSLLLTSLIVIKSVIKRITTLNRIANRITFLNRQKTEQLAGLFLAIIAINTGYVLVGRYNQTSIIFLFPFFYLLTITLVKELQRLPRNLFITVILLSTIITSGLNLNSDTYFNDYQRYLREIARGVEQDAVVLANLNTEYYFENSKLYDYRNLSELKNYGLTFSEYIERNGIEYIIYPEEMDFIYNTRPVWNGLYGNLVPYYQEMKDFFQNNCQLVHEFENEVYGMRIARYIGKKDWKIKIFKVLKY